MKKITFLTLHLGYGGVESAITALANSLTSDYFIEIVSVYQRYDNPVFKLNKNIEIKYLIGRSDVKIVKEQNILKCLKAFIIKSRDIRLEAKLIREYIENCDSDIIISTNARYNELVGKYANSNTLKIGWEHSYHNDNKKYIKKVVDSTKNLDYFVLVSNVLYNFYSELMVDKHCKCIYIPNSLEYIPDNLSKLKEKNIITIGKLAKEKGYVDLVEIFKYVSLKYPDWKLNIIGDGPQKELIEEQIAKYKLENNVILHGFRDKKYIKKMFEKSSIYVMSSSSEGFGIVLLEAFSYGIPCVAFDSALGAKELISNNWDGYLISNLDKEKMTKKIIDLIKNENRRIVMGNNARKKSLRFTTDVIKEMWLEILN